MNFGTEDVHKNLSSNLELNYPITKSHTFPGKVNVFFCLSLHVCFSSCVKICVRNLRVMAAACSLSLMQGRHNVIHALIMGSNLSLAV